MNLQKRTMKILFASVLLLFGVAVGGNFISWKAEAKTERAVGTPALTEYLSADLNRADGFFGNADYRVFENGNKELSVAFIAPAFPDGTVFSVELDNVVIAQPSVSNGLVLLTIASPDEVPTVAVDSSLVVKIGTETFASGTFVRRVIRATNIYVADGIGAKVIPSVNTDAVATGILFFGDGEQVAEIVVIGTNFASAPLSVTINGPAPGNENAPVLFNVEDIQTIPVDDSVLFIGTAIIEINPITIGQLSDGLLYIEVKTPEFPNGEVRGQFELYNPDADFEGDGRADISVYRPSEGTWYFLNSLDQQTRAIPFGGANDKIVPGDFDGDGITDLALFRKSGGLGYWTVRCSSDSVVTTTQWGLDTDTPVVADFDGDGRDDLTVFRPATGTWYVRRASDVIKPRADVNDSVDITITQWGLNGDIPFATDFDGDGRADLTVYRPSNGTWYILNSSNNQAKFVNWGLPTDIPLVGDFDGDGRGDVTVFRPSNGTWYSLSSLGEPLYYQFGLDGDIPTAADYDGDGQTDFSVYRPSEGTWYGLKSLDNQFFNVRFGLNGDVPTTAP
jgi:hypothetical protein